MRIRNNGKAIIYFNEGALLPNKVFSFTGEMEKMGALLLSSYPDRLEDLDNIKVDEEIDVKSALVSRAKELGIRGNVDGMKEETLKAKIAEAENK